MENVYLEQNSFGSLECALSEGFNYAPTAAELIVIDFDDAGLKAVSDYIDMKESLDQNRFDPNFKIQNQMFTHYNDQSEAGFEQVINNNSDIHFDINSHATLNADLALTGNSFSYHSNAPSYEPS